MRNGRFLLATLTLLVLVTAVWAQQKAPKTIKRAAPPKFDAGDRTFFADAFKEALEGERPGDLGRPPSAVVAAPSGSGAGAPAAGGGGLAGSGWSAIISGATLEDSIKGLKLQVDQSITTPSDFAGKGYKAARRDFSMMAMLFAIVGEYDGEVRWKSTAPAARDVFARTAANAKVGTSQVFQEAKLRKTELQDLVGGQSPFEGKGGEAKAAWNTVCDRSPLMQYLEAVWEPTLKPSLGDKGQFNANIDRVMKDAELFAAIGAVLAKEGMEDADAAEYKEFCVRLQKASQTIAEACRNKDFEKASAAAGEIGKSCTECHENYRS